MSKKAVLIILDGYGLAAPTAGNDIEFKLAQTVASFLGKQMES